jgi:hypothetical protein
MTKEKILPLETIFILEILPVIDGILELSGLGNMMGLGEINALRDLQQGYHVVLCAKTTYAFENSLPRHCIFCNIVFGRIIACKHTADVHSRDLGLQRFGGFILHLFARDWINASILLAKDHLNVSNVPVST